MGMSASQARLLNITARLSDLELSEQLISNKKIRLAVKSDAVSQKYLDALNGTTTTTDNTVTNNTSTPKVLSYGEVAGPDATLSSQYCVVDGTSGKVLVSEAMGANYAAAKGTSAPLDKFLELNNANKEIVGSTKTEQVHTQAWNDADADVTRIDNELKNIPQFVTGKVTKEMADKYKQDVIDVGNAIQGDRDLLVIIRGENPVNTSEETRTQNEIDLILLPLQQSLLDHPLIEGDNTSYVPNKDYSDKFGEYQGAVTKRDKIDPAYETKTITIPGKVAGVHADKAQYYTNLFNQMGGGKTDNYKTEAGDTTINKKELFNQQLTSGTLKLKKFDATTGTFKDSTTVSNSDFNISGTTTVKDGTTTTTTTPLSDTDLKKVELEYDKEMDKIHNQDKQYDMQMKQLDTEHNALQTEYDSVSKVIDKNIQRTLKTFQA